MKHFLNPVCILYSNFRERLPNSIYNQYLQKLPHTLRVKNTAYRRWQDRHAHLFGKLLLLEGIKKFGFSDNILFHLKYNAYQRPYSDWGIDFNISHSGNYVICVLGNNIKLGVDIERINDINFNDFFQTMNSKQWRSICNSAKPNKTFFRYWTIKESMTKADGRGLFIPTSEIHFTSKSVSYNGTKWHLKELNIDADYCCSLVTNKSNIEPKLIKIDF